MIEKVGTTQIINTVDIVADIVSKVRLEYDVNNKTPYFMHGHPLEIINTLKEYTINKTLKFEKFPLVALFEDIDSSGRNGLIDSQSQLNILFITDTLPTYKAAKRYDESFDKVLTPIYNLFLKHYKLSRRVCTPTTKLSLTKTNHLFWGAKGLYGNTANFFEDAIDAIELKIDFKVYR